MESSSKHLRDKLQELADGRLVHEDLASAREHLEQCAQCERELRALIWAKGEFRKSYPILPVPSIVRSNILAALDNEDRLSVFPASISGWSFLTTRRTVLAFGVLALFGFAGFALFFAVREDLTSKNVEVAEFTLPSPTPVAIRYNEIPQQASNDFLDYKSRQLPLVLKTTNVSRMEKFFAENGIDFETRVFDLGMMGYRLVGGRVNRLHDRTSSLFVYRGEKGETLVCQMYPGKVAELPRQASIREDNGISFFVYSESGITTIFWQEGNVICVLASDIDQEKLVDLAFAKAVKV